MGTRGLFCLCGRSLAGYSVYPSGDITSAVIMKTATGESRGFGFVNFKETEQAQAACSALNNLVTDDPGAPVVISRACVPLCLPSPVRCSLSLYFSGAPPSASWTFVFAVSGARGQWFPTH